MSLAQSRPIEVNTLSENGPHSPRQEAYTNHTKWRRLEEKAAIMVMAFVAVLVSLILIVVLGVIT